MKILITGSQGFIGSKVLEYLKSQGHDIMCTLVDIRSKEALRPFFEDIELVFHAAGKVKDVHNKKVNYAVNVLGTNNVAELCIEYGCKMIHLSSVQMHTPYGRSKQESQKRIEEYSRQGLKVIVLRLCPIITKDSGISIKRRYYLEDLVVDIGNIIKTHNFNKYKLIDYSHEKYIFLPKP